MIVCLALLAGAGCRSRVAEAGPQACAPSEETLPADASADALAGTYRLQLVASKASGAGESASGELRLQPAAAADRHRSYLGVRDTMSLYPLYGSTDVNLEVVGAVAGDLTSTDPSGPGVLVIRTASRSDTAGARVMLRLGAEANRQDKVRFDGGYTVLRVREITDGGFRGGWESGAPLPQASGHFCAVRSGEEG